MAFSRTENTVRNTMAAYMLQVVSMIARFISQTIFISLLGKQYAGVAGVFSDILQMLAASELGIGAAVLFSLYRPIKNEDHSKVAAYMLLLKKVYHIIAIAIMGGGIILLPFLRYIVKDVPDIKENIYIVFLLFVAKTALSYLFHYRAVLFEAYQYKRVQSYINCTVTVVVIAIQTIVLYLTRQYYLFLLLDIIGVGLSNCILAVIYSKQYPFIKKEKRELSKEEKSGVWKNVGNLSLYRIATIALNATDSVIVSSMLGTEVVGALSGYRMLINYVSGFAGQFLHSALPSIGDAAVSETKEYNFLLFKRLSFCLYAITCVTATCLFALLSPFVQWWLGADYVAPIGVVCTLVMNYYTSMMMIVNTSFRNVYGLFNEKPFSPLYMAILNISLSIALGKCWGLIGIFAATSISRLLTLLWIDPWLLYKNIYRVPMRNYWKETLKELLLLTLSCTLTYLCVCCLPDGFVFLFIRLSIALTISCITVWLAYRKSDEISYSIKKVKKLFKRS